MLVCLVNTSDMIFLSVIRQKYVRYSLCFGSLVSVWLDILKIQKDLHFCFIFDRSMLESYFQHPTKTESPKAEAQWLNIGRRILKLKFLSYKLGLNVKLNLSLLRIGLVNREKV